MELKSRDGHSFRAYTAGNADAPAGMIVVQEIFGVNAHIRDVCDRLADQGYQVISPALFDRADRGSGDYGVELSYDADGIKQGQALAKSVGMLENPLLDIEACLRWFAPAKKVGLVGFCWGGTLAWLSACKLHPDGGQPRGGLLDACVGYYGGMIPKLLADPPGVPVMLHFGEKDDHIPLSDVEAIRTAYPRLAEQIFTYPAGHGFNCDARASFEPTSAALAWGRTLKFFEEHLRPA